MSDLLGNSELSAINHTFATAPVGRYAIAPGIIPSETTLERIRANLSEDLGEGVAARAFQAPHISRLGVIGLYDGLYQRLAAVPPDSIQISPLNVRWEERGTIHLIKFADEAVVVKGWQGKQEPEIARLASELNIGPRVYGSGSKLVEDYLPQISLRHLHPSQFGQMAGELLRQLHDRNIIFSDSLSDHLRYDRRDKSLKLIDYGTAFHHDGTTPVDNDYLWRVTVLMQGLITVAQLMEIQNDPSQAARYATIDPEELMVIELKKMKAELTSSVKFPIQYGGHRLFTRGQYTNSLNEGIRAGYQNPKP